MWLEIIFVCVFGCTYALTTSFDLGGVVSKNRLNGVPSWVLRGHNHLGAGEVDLEGVCTEPGTTCQNCSHAITCVPLPAGWLKVPLEECPEGATCNAHEGGCSYVPVPECEVNSQQFTYTCEQVGVFPDAFDCRKFHLCSPPEDVPEGRPADHRTAICPINYGYNPQTAQCSIKLHRGQCTEKPVPECTKIGQTGVLPWSMNHYYVCILKNNTLYPQVFICPHGWFFSYGFCRPEQQIETTTETPTTERTTTTQQATITTQQVTSTRTELFFSTEKRATYAPDTFLADKFDLTNYESTDDVLVPPSSSGEFTNSFESGNDFW